MKLEKGFMSAFFYLFVLLALAGIGADGKIHAAEAAKVTSAPAAFRAPSVPLIVHDPYFSVWSASNALTDSETVHWTGTAYPIHAMVQINGKSYRLLGADPADVPAMPQKSTRITATRTICQFETEEAKVQLTFMSPILPASLDLMSRPSTFVTAEIVSKSKKELQTKFYFDSGAELAVDKPDQIVDWTTPNYGDFLTARLGTETQDVLNRSGDNHRIDWGYLFLSGSNGKDISQWNGQKVDASLKVGNGEKLRRNFGAGREIASTVIPMPAVVGKEKVTIAYSAASEKAAIRSICTVVYAYNDRSSIEYFNTKLMPYWKQGRKVCEDLILDSWADFLTPGKGRSQLSAPLVDLCAKFDDQMTRDLSAVGGEKYALVCSLVWRHALGAQKIVADANGMPLMFSKENFSNGCIGTVDLMYPCSPLLLYYSPILEKATVEPILAYAESSRWKFPFAPHDLGQYPLANGQVYGGGERTVENQMPVEETGNMLIQLAALAVLEGNADYASRHWPLLTRWAEYLAEKGFDPENQLCTDDFAGHLAHNVNLSAKAIMGLASYAKLAELRGETEMAKRYYDLAKSFVVKWMRQADNGDHYRLAFDRPDTWSMKYNIFWDKVLGFNLFPDSVMEKEIAYYRTVMQPFGLPLDNRSLYTKNDWILWIAAQTKNRADFDMIFDPFYRYVNETPDRVPVSDWYWADSAKLRGFRARSVVGGYWAPMLRDLNQWRKQAAQAQSVQGNWAPVPARFLKDRVLAPSAVDQKEPVIWKYSFKKPGKDWISNDFDDSKWKSGKAGFGTNGTPGANVGTVWNTKSIWLRRTVEISDDPSKMELGLFLHHDEDAEIFVNGKRVLGKNKYSSDYETFYVPQLATCLVKGKNTIAVSCRQTKGGQYIDLGIVTVKKEK